IEVTINDPDGVVDSSIVLRVNEIEFTVDSPQVSWSEPTLIFVPSAPFADGETVYVDLLSADDVFGNPLEGAPISWRFYIDRTPPTMWGETPAPDEVISSPHFALSCRIDDEGSGLDTNSIQLFVGDSTFVYGDPCITVEPGPGDAFTLISVDSLCLPTPPCDTITIRLVATDTTDYCEDNILDTSWTIYTDCEPPSATIVFPAESVWYSCPEESVVVTLWDDAPGVDTATIALSAMGDGGYMESAVWGDPGLSYDFGTGTLVWHPATPFPNAGNVVITVGASDLLGNAMPRLSWIIFMDRIPPEVAAISPECDEVVATVHPDIYIVATDSGCGEITPSVTINGTDYSDFEFAGDTIRVSPSAVPVFSGGDTITVCWHLTDCAGDVCEPNATDTCCTFSVAAGGPVATIHNPTDSAFVACADFEVHITIADPDGIIADSVVLGAVIGSTPSTFGLSDPPVSYTEYDDSIVVVWTPPASDGQQVEIYVASAYDSLFNSLSYSDDVVFVFDFSPPHFSGITPAGGSVVDETAPTICVDIADDGSGVDWSAVGFVIDGTTYGASSPAVSVDPITGQMCFDPAAAGISWYGGDTVDVCAFAQDSPDTCGPNADTTCWSFSIATGGPTVEIISPYDGVVDACFPDSVVWNAHDPNGIDPSSLELIFLTGDDTTHFTSDSAGVDIALSSGGDSATISLQIPAGIPDGESVLACLVALTDSLGNPAGTTCVEFSVDYGAPYVEIISPGDGEVVHSTQPEIAVVVNDSGSGIDTSALELTVNGTVYTLADPCLDFAADTLIFNPAGCGVVWFGGDTITVCLHAPDLADTDFCGPNVADTCWSFVVAADPPTTEIVRPLDSTTTSCEPETVKIAITDPDGVADTSIALTLNGDTLRVDAPGVSFDGTTLFVALPEDIPEGEVEVCLISAADNLGNGIPAPVCFVFWIDRTPPIVVNTVPADSTLTADRTQNIAVALYDSVAGVDTSSVVLSVNGGEVPHEDLVWSFEGDTVYVRYIPENAGVEFAPGDTIEVSLSVTDTTDYCEDNIFDTSFVFFIEPEVGCRVHPNPFTPDGDGINEITVFDYPGMFSRAGKLEVFDIRGVKVYEGEIGPVAGFDDVASRRWDGTDTQGSPLAPGLYMYVIIVDGEVVCSGTVVLAR
ncbi:gliding motility-associated C-terminal domain-containing protein, partial [bacterium]|nr:gliding motility-associated C-terminal domain-containing protein [bacterium]